MTLAVQSTKIAIAVAVAFAGSQVRAQSANSADAEIAALKKQLRLMEEKLDRLQKQTAANTAAAAKAPNAKAEANAKVAVVNANGVVPVKAPAAPPDAVVHMPNQNEHFDSLLPLVPGVVRGPNGQINMKGARASQNGSLVNSADVTDPATGATAIKSRTGS